LKQADPRAKAVYIETPIELYATAAGIFYNNAHFQTQKSTRRKVRLE
jgi:hypothetical protein